MTGTVLIVDDDRETVATLAEALAEAGFAVRIAYDGEMALDAIDRAQADVVLADVRMPRLDGVGLLRQLGSREPRTPVLLMTAWPATVGEHAPGIPVMRKPIDLDAVVAAVSAAMGRVRRAT